jgi:HSP90 family molecular chaperone
VREIRILQSGKMNYVITSFIEQELLCLKEDLGEFLEEKKIKDFTKRHSEFLDIQLIDAVKKTKEEEINNDEGKATEVEIENKKVNKNKKKEGHNNRASIKTFQ